MTNMSLALTFARREMRAGIAGFYVFIACLILGVAAIAAIQSLSRGFVEALRHDGREILGADIALRTMMQPIPVEQLDWIDKNIGAVSRVTQTRGMARRPDESKAAMTEVKAVEKNYPVYGSVSLTDEAGKPLAMTVQEALAVDGDNFGAAVEKEVLSRLDLHLGDKIMVGQQGFVLKAIIAHEPDRLSSMGYNLAPRLLVSMQALGKTGLVVEGAQLYYDQRIILPQAKTQADLDRALEAINAHYPKQGNNWRARDSFNAAPRAEEIIGRLAFYLTLIGLTTLLVGGVGISNAVRGYLEAKLSNIATLKCLGAPGGFVLRVYLLLMGALALLGSAIGLVLGVVAAQIAGGWLMDKFGLSAQMEVYPDVLAIALAFGLLTAFVFSLWPLGRAIRVKPADLFRDTIEPGTTNPSGRILTAVGISAVALAALAIGTAENHKLAAWFVLAALLTFAVFYGASDLMRAGLKKLRPPGQPEARMAIANLYRPGNATTSVILSLGLGLTVLVSIALVQYNFSRLIGDDVAADAPSFFFLDLQKDQLDDFSKTIHAVKSARDLELTPSLRGRITKVNGKPAEQMLVDKSRDWVIRSDRGFTYMGAAPKHGEITAGKWWAPDYKGAPLVSIAGDVAKAFNITVGDTLTANILGVETTATVANVRDIDWTSFTMNFAVTFAPGALEDAPATYLATVITAPSDEEALQASLAKQFPSITSIRVGEALQTAGVLIDAVAEAVRISAAVTLAAGALVLAGGVAAARRRHVYDAVVLKVLGAERRRILKTFLLEYGILGLITVTIAAALGTLGAFAVIHFIMQLGWKFSILALLKVVALCLAVTLSAGFLGTWQALRQKPAPYLRNL